jgi:hypothetical protein
MGRGRRWIVKMEEDAKVTTGGQAKGKSHMRIG